MGKGPWMRMVCRSEFLLQKVPGIQTDKVAQDIGIISLRYESYQKFKEWRC